ncbi:hypothetical protein DK389_28850 [Methylobacterium durans]|uniref:Uncharacterized protein n=1 Tax=Methylobacterium durans TaxID=2202825 RepID=A0A2U8WCA8_9HYPH|nr:hypothetical protein DK389_28850 [Methylobacterium durans]
MSVLIQDTAERHLAPLRGEGLRYRMWVTGTPRSSTVHMRVTDLTSEMKARIAEVLSGRGVLFEIEDAQAA